MAARSHLIRGPGELRRRLNRNAVPGPDVMQEEVAVRMDDLVPERCRDDEGAAVDPRARPSRCEMDSVYWQIGAADAR